jgi:hypothetical protein
MFPLAFPSWLFLFLLATPRWLSRLTRRAPRRTYPTPGPALGRPWRPWRAGCALA